MEPLQFLGSFLRFKAYQKSSAVAYFIRSSSVVQLSAEVIHSQYFHTCRGPYIGMLKAARLCLDEFPKRGLSTVAGEKKYHPQTGRSGTRLGETPPPRLASMYD